MSTSHKITLPNLTCIGSLPRDHLKLISCFAYLMTATFVFSSAFQDPMHSDQCQMKLTARYFISKGQAETVTTVHLPFGLAAALPGYQVAELGMALCLRSQMPLSLFMRFSITILPNNVQNRPPEEKQSLRVLHGLCQQKLRKTESLTLILPGQNISLFPEIVGIENIRSDANKGRSDGWDKVRNVDRGANASTSAAAGAGTCLGAHRAGWRGHWGKRGRCAYTPEGQNTRIAIYTISEFRS